MIIDLKRSIDLRWLFADRCYIHLRWSCFFLKKSCITPFTIQAREEQYPPTHTPSKTHNRGSAEKPSEACSTCSFISDICISQITFMTQESVQDITTRGWEKQETCRSLSLQLLLPSSYRWLDQRCSERRRDELNECLQVFSTLS